MSLVLNEAHPHFRTGEGLNEVRVRLLALRHYCFFSALVNMQQHDCVVKASA